MAANDETSNLIDPKNDQIAGMLGETACETKIKYRDVFHLKNLYRYMHEWLINDGWGSHTDSKWPEELYFTNQRSDGEEIWVWRRLNKFRQNKESGYFKKFMDVDMHILYLKNQEIVLNGQKLKANNGECEIIIRGRLAVDPDKQWRKHWFLKHINEWWWESFQDDKKEYERQELYQDCYKFHAAIKSFFKMYQVEPERMPFRAHGGLETK
jgi:hypothetical protein